MDLAELVWTGLDFDSMVALSTGQIVTKAMQMCYREDDFGDDAIDGPLLLMVKARSADPYMGRKGGNPYASGQRYEEWATKALQEIMGETPQTWSRTEVSCRRTRRKSRGPSAARCAEGFYGSTSWSGSSGDSTTLTRHQDKPRTGR